MGGLMRLYGGRVIRNRVNRQFAERKELRDAVVYEVVSASRYAWVQIQGSQERIKAYFPENWEATPQYVKRGNAVRISHPGGNKGRIEISGHGTLIPTPVEGGSLPEPPTPGDAVLSGCNLSPVNPAAMAAIVNPGSYRIGGITYSIVGMMMDRTDIVMDREDLIMDRVGDVVTFDAAHATLFRYDSVVAGTDGEADVVKGSNFAYNADPIPDPPDAPANHVRVGWVLIYPGMTTVTAADINRIFVEPVATVMEVVTDDTELAWGEATAGITVTIRDQYGNVKPGLGAGYYVTFSWLRGNGTLSYGASSATPSQELSFYMSSSAEVTYTRTGDGDDVSPVFTISDSVTGLSNSAYVNLYDVDGNEMV